MISHESQSFGEAPHSKKSNVPGSSEPAQVQRLVTTPTHTTKGSNAQSARPSNKLNGLTPEARNKALTTALTAQLTDIGAAKRATRALINEACPELVNKRRWLLATDFAEKAITPLLMSIVASSGPDRNTIAALAGILVAGLFFSRLRQERRETQQLIGAKIWGALLKKCATQASRLNFSDRGERTIQAALSDIGQDFGSAGTAFLNSLFDKQAAWPAITGSLVGIVMSAWSHPASWGYNLTAVAIVATGAALTLPVEAKKKSLNQQIESEMVGHRKVVFNPLYWFCQSKTAQQLGVAVQSTFPEEHMNARVGEMTEKHIVNRGKVFKLERTSLLINSLTTGGAALFLLYNWFKGTVPTETLAGFTVGVTGFQFAVCSLIESSSKVHEAAMKANKTLGLAEHWKKVSEAYGINERVFTPAEIAEWKAKLKGKDIDFVLSDIMVKKDNNPQDETILNVQGSITIKANTLTGIVGESGAGKTTFVSVLIGTLKPTAGVVSIHVDGSSYRLSDIPLEALHNEIGYSEQDGFQGDGIGVKRYINLGANEHDSSRKLAPEKALEIAQVKFLDHLQLDTTVIGNNNSFSGGEKSRLKVAQVLVGNRKTLIWDEPHTGLDNSNKGEILKLIFEKYRRSKTQIYISHDLSGFDQCDQIIVIERGKAVMSGTAADMKRLSSHYQSLIAIAGEHPVPTIWNKPRAGADDSMDQLTLPGL